MDKIRLACGRRAENPYMFEKMMARVYSVEELCYCIMLDAYLLDESFASIELATWLGEECGLDELEKKLKTAIRNNCSVDRYAGMILDYVGFYDREAVEETCNVIRDNASLSFYEKNKARADYYLMSGRIMLALSAYNELLESIPEREKRVRASIWHNCGYAYARLFRYSEAAKAYYCAYKTLPEDESLRQFLTALRLSKSDTDYLDYVSGHPEFYEMSQKVEQGINKATGQFEGTDEYRMIAAMKVLREEGTGSSIQPTPYYQQLDELTEELKNSYREMVSV